MAFSVNGLQVIAASNKDAGGLYMYFEAETLANMRGSGYFNNAVDAGLVVDDIIWLIGSDGHGMNQVNVSGSTYTLDEAITSV
jgi:hypothetical protein